MKLLHVYSGNLYGGIESMLVSCASAASLAPGLEQQFALCFDGQLAETLRLLGARVHLLGPVRVRRPGTVLAARQALDAVLVGGGFDRIVCHAPWSQALFGSVARRRGVSVAFWAHDAMTGRHWTERCARFVAPDLVVCNSAFTAGTLAALYARTPSVVIHPPVWTTSASEGQPSNPAALRAALTTSPDACVIVQASRAEAWKGHTVLLDALTELAHVPNWVWWVVGGAQRPAEAEYFSRLRATATGRAIGDRIRWVGQRTDVPAVLAASDLYCQPNLGPEPFGIALVEALAAGLPVVTSDLGAAREVIDAHTGVLVPPGDAHALARALEPLIADRSRRARLAQAAPERARRLSDPASQLAKLSDALARLAPLEATA